MGDAQKLCTLKVPHKLYPSLDSHKLSALPYSLGFEIDRFKIHTADGDLDLLRQLLMRECADAGCGIDGLVVMSNVPPETISFGKHKGAKFKDLPRNYVSWLLLQQIDDELRSMLMKL